MFFVMNLKKMSLEPAEQKTLRRLLKKYPTNLDLSKISALKDKHLTFLLQEGGKLLQKISLNDCNHITDKSLMYLLSHCPVLQEVGLWKVRIGHKLLQQLQKICNVFVGYRTIYINPFMPPTVSYIFFMVFIHKNLCRVVKEVRGNVPNFTTRCLSMKSTNTSQSILCIALQILHICIYGVRVTF